MKIEFKKVVPGTESLFVSKVTVIEEDLEQKKK